MNQSTQGDESASRNAAQFATTHWSVVLAAGDSASPDSGEALEKLCRTYWRPVYVFLRRRGYGHQQAEDLTQGFFAQLIGKNLAGRADPERGRFRSFLLRVLTQFVTDEHRHNKALKRGGDKLLLPINPSLAEEGLNSEAPEDPEIAFIRRWALSVLDEVLRLLREESIAAGKGDSFEALSPYLQGERGLPRYADVAEQLGISEGAVKTGIHRMRQRYRELLRAVVAQTVQDPAEIDDEIRFLIGTLCR